MGYKYFKQCIGYSDTLSKVEMDVELGDLKITDKQWEEVMNKYTDEDGQLIHTETIDELKKVILERVSSDVIDILIDSKEFKDGEREVHKELKDRVDEVE